MTNKNEQKPLERIQRVRLPFDGRADDPKKNYGIGSLIVWFILKGDKGAVQFRVCHNDEGEWFKIGNAVLARQKFGPIVGMNIRDAINSLENALSALRDAGKDGAN